MLSDLMTQAQLRPKLTICGSFGFSNVGDEALPLAISDLAKDLNIEVDIQVLGRFPRPDLPNVIGLDPKYKERQSQLQGHPLLLAGGGVVETKSHSVLFRCSKYLSKSFTPTLALYAANVESGIQYNWPVRWQIANLLRNFERLYVRDVISGESLRSLLPGREIEVIGDSVLWMKPASTVPPAIESLKSFIVVTLASHVSWKNDPSWQQWIAKQICELAVYLKSAIAFVPCSTKFDKDCLEHRRVADNIRHLNSDLEIVCLEQDETSDPRIFSAILSRSLLTISMRLHGCVMAYAQKVPFVALAYHPKVFGFAKTIGWEQFCLPQNLPNYQSRGSYGYTFTDTKIQESNLVKTALKALEYSLFEQLYPLKSRLSEAFLDVWKLHHSSLNEIH